MEGCVYVPTTKRNFLNCAWKTKSESVIYSNMLDAIRGCRRFESYPTFNSAALSAVQKGLPFLDVPAVMVGNSYEADLNKGTPRILPFYVALIVEEIWLQKNGVGVLDMLELIIHPEKRDMLFERRRPLDVLMNEKREVAVSL